MKDPEKHLCEISTRVFVDRIPFLPDLFFCAASVEPRCGGRIDVAGVGRAKEQAVISAYGEAVETLSQDVRDSDPILSGALETGECPGWLAVIPDALRQKQMTAYDHDGSFAFKAPAACVLRMNEGGDTIPPISEGAAAGPTTEFAKLAGMLELIERDSVARWWRGGQPARRVSSGVMDRVGEDPRQVLVLDLSHGALAPVVAMISRCVRSKAFVFAAACRPSFSDARFAAFRELVQFEVAQISRRHRYGDNAPSDDPEDAEAREKILDLAGPFNDTLDAAPDLRADQTSRVLEELLLRAERRGIRFGFTDLTRQEFELAVVKTISPDLEPSGIQSTTPSILSLRKVWGTPDPKRAMVELYR